MGKYVLGIDAGGTKTLAIIATTAGEVAGLGRGGPVNSNFVSDETISRSLADAIGAALASFGQEQFAFIAIYVSAPGVQAKHVKDSLSLLTQDVQFTHLEVATNDTMSAFVGALVEPPGVVVLSGTGSFAFGIDGSGNRYSAGGWGPLLGDEGSGYFIGRLALESTARVLDGRAKATPVSNLVTAGLNVTVRRDLERVVYKEGLNRQEIAALARLVSMAADQEDPVALGILRRAGVELAALAIHLLEQMPEKSCRVALTGGVAKANQALFDQFSQSISALFPNSTVKKGRFSPALGAVLLALKGIEVPLGREVLQKLDDFALREGLTC